MTTFLTHPEIIELTGFKKPSKQISWLRQQGFVFRVAADGYPRIDRSHYLKLMGGYNNNIQPKTEPNFNSLKNTQSC